MGVPRKARLWAVHAFLLVVAARWKPVIAYGEPMTDGLLLVYVNEGTLLTDSGANPTFDQPDLFISMPHVMLAGQSVAGAPAGAAEERACAAACRATSQCNIYLWCPAAEGCSVSVTNSTGDTLPYRHCELAQQPNVLIGQAHPPEAVEKGPSVTITSGQIVPDMNPRPLEGFTLHMCLGMFGMYDYECAGTMQPNVCMRQGSLQEAKDQCEQGGVKCMGIRWFPLGRDFLGPNIYMLKGIPDQPTPANFPSVPIDLNLTNWNGNSILYIKNMNATQLAAASAYLPSAQADGGLSAGAVAGIATGAAVAALALAVGTVLILRRRSRKHVADAEAASKHLKAGERPGELSVGEMASMSSGKASKGSCSRGLQPPSGQGLSPAPSPADVFMSEMGKEWLVDVSQIKFVMDKERMPRKLGSGAQGTVYEALLNGVTPVAVKVVPVGDATAAFLHEARMLRSLRHRNVVHLMGVALHGDKAMVLTELMEGRDLFSRLNVTDKSGQRMFSWHRRGKRVALDVASALAYLHGKHVMHFDIKASNVLLTRDLTAKLADVGLSKNLTHTLATQKDGPVGTFAWCAPELLMNKPCTLSADIYSFGVLLFEICTGEVPEVVDLLRRCLSEDPMQRPTASQLVEELSTLAGMRLSRHGLLLGEEGLEAATTAQAGASDPQAEPALAVDGRALVGVAALPGITMPSPFTVP
ncbi:hypothetical protein ABPG77_005363 [Micractinium sp. CCAP 211/92]